MITLDNNFDHFEDLMDITVETEDKWLNKKLNSNICYFGGGGGGGQQQQDVPPTLRPYVTEVLERASGEYGPGVQYQPYMGERVVGFTPAEALAQRGILEQAGQRGLAQVAPGLTTSAAYYAPAYGLLGEVGARQRAGAADIGAAELQERMSPYQQAVVDIEKRQARLDAAQTAQAIGAKAAGMGAFGGSRQAVLEAQAASDLGQRLADIQARGQQAAYQDALRSAEAQRARQFQAAQGLGALSGQYGQLGQQALGQGYRELGYISGVGEAQRGLQQQRADIAYDAFREQRDFPTEQLQRYSSLIQGFPYQITMPGAQPSPMQQAIGTGIAGVGIGRSLGFFKKGGDVGKGGLTDLSGDGKITQKDVLIGRGVIEAKQGGGLATVYRQDAGKIRPGLLDFSRGPFAELSRRYNAETDPVKKEQLRKELIAQGQKTRAESSFLSQFVNPDVPDPYLMAQLQLDAKTAEDTRLGRFGRGVVKRALEIPQTTAEIYKGIRGVGRSLGDYLTTPVGEYQAQRQQLEEEYKKAEETKKKPDDADKPKDKPKKKDALDTITESLTGEKATDAEADLLKVIRDAYDVDKEKLEKAAKSKEGLALAAFGAEYASKPLSEVDYIRAAQTIGDATQERLGVDQVAKTAAAKGALAEIQAMKALKELNNAGQLVDLSLQDLNLLAEGVGRDLKSVVTELKTDQATLLREAQLIASVEAAQRGVSADSQEAKSIGLVVLQDLLEGKRKLSPYGKRLDGEKGQGDRVAAGDVDKAAVIGGPSRT